MTAHYPYRDVWGEVGNDFFGSNFAFRPLTRPEEICNQLQIPAGRALRSIAGSRFPATVGTLISEEVIEAIINAHACRLWQKLGSPSGVSS